MSGIAPTPPTAATAATAGLAASAMRRAPEDADRPVAPEAEAPRRTDIRAAALSPQPDPDGHRGRLVNVFA